MSLFTGRELDEMRKAQETAMPNTATVQRRSNSDDGFGGRTGTTWTDVYVDQKCRITMAQTLDLGGQGGRKIELEKWTVRFPFGLDVREHDRVIFGDITISVDEVKVVSFETVLSVAGEQAK